MLSVNIYYKYNNVVAYVLEDEQKMYTKYGKRISARLSINYDTMIIKENIFQ